MKARNLIDLEDISLEDIDEIIHLAGMIKANPSIFTDACHGKIMATLFYEPSTRTQMSFKTAMLRLGGEVIGFDNPSNASVSKGESLKDTVRVVSNYADVLVMRNPIEGSAYAASLYSKSPVINAGDGGHLHPTQTLADLVTLSHEKGRLSDLTIGLCGDMKNGRTVHSLVKALSKYKNNKFVMISTPELQMPEYIIDILKKSGCEYSFSSSLEEAISSLDVLYMTRIQQERFKSEEEYERQKGVYVLDEEKMKLAKGEREKIKDRMDTLMERRKDKQPLEYPSAGSTFKRPEGDFAARLIEVCGLKGTACGGAEVSTKHSGFIINKDNATFDDVMGVVDIVKQKVKEQTGVTLECEVLIMK